MDELGVTKASLEAFLENTDEIVSESAYPAVRSDYDSEYKEETVALKPLSSEVVAEYVLEYRDSPVGWPVNEP